MKKLFLLTVLFLFFSGVSSVSAQSLGNHFFQTPDGALKAWVFLQDKGPQQNSQLQKAQSYLTQRAIKRRMKVRGEAVIDSRDLPLYRPYLQEIKPLVQKIRTKSKWLNAVSVEVSAEQLEALRKLPFVKEIRPVMCFRRNGPEVNEDKSVNTKITAAANQSNINLDYGASLDQAAIINVPILHEQGYYGQGVLICLLDDGFNLLNHHITFDSLDVLATWDFINDDESVDDSEFEASEGTHGTKTLSTIGGYTPGQLIGAAFKATYILGKTEVDASETPVEEDYWVAGLEWADSLGADVLSSSLGYIDWYTWQDMDGETAVTTVAADQAVDNGLLLLNSAGNEGYNADHNTLIAPADGNNVLAIAAVTSSGDRASFSSVGPSADGRIKPDLAAMGSSCYTASSYDSTGFVYASGTSFSCPTAAGAAALLLCAHPELTPFQIHDALRQTASQANAPDNLLGWGIIDIAGALDYIDAASTMISGQGQTPQTITLFQNYPNPFNPRTSIRYQVSDAAWVNLSVYNMLGQKLATLVSKRQPAGTHRVAWNASRFASGVYYYNLTVNGRYIQTKKMILIQ